MSWTISIRNSDGGTIRLTVDDVTGARIMEAITSIITDSEVAE